MNITSFLEHHGILRNPFAEEDAQTDQVFKEHCISSAYHPIWDKVYGDPSEPSTSIIFGPKGSGKTAIRLQIDRHLTRYNEAHPQQRVFVIRYDDFNPFLDHFCERMGKRVAKKPDKVLDAWRLWDHMDAILCLGVTDLINRILNPSDTTINKQAVMKLDRTASRDLMLLATCYDQSTASSFASRWGALRSAVRYGNWTAKWSYWLSLFSAIGSCVLVAWIFWRGRGGDAEGAAEPVNINVLWLIPIITLIFSLPMIIKTIKSQVAALGIRKHMRVGKRDVSSLRKALQRFPASELDSQPLPRFDRTDDRYELLNKFRGILEPLGFVGIIVLLDRVDEPHMTGGKSELMQKFVWPILDNKLLKHPGIGFKMMLPQELHRDIERETREFHERARLDKQNVIPAFQWTGESLYDLARARMMACAADGRSPEPRDLFGDEVSYERMLSAFQSLRVPRHLFRFLYRVLVDHCNRYTDAHPVYKIKGETFESNLAVYSRESDLNLN
jgi:cytochrome c-type biogenesis protein CcmH/NrfF